MGERRWAEVVASDRESNRTGGPRNLETSTSTTNTSRCGSHQNLESHVTLSTSTMGKPDVDYSVYLVTGRELLPDGKDYYESLEESLQGGVTVVQVREKDIDTGAFVEIARRTKEVCDKVSCLPWLN